MQRGVQTVPSGSLGEIKGKEKVQEEGGRRGKAVPLL